MALFAHGEESARRPLPRGICVRQGTEQDEFPTFEVMRRAMGYEMSWTNHAASRRHLRTAPRSSFWVAEETPRFGATRVIGYARSLVRDRVWSLTEFFVLPGHHRKGIGGALLARCLADGEKEEADTRLVLASQHPSADSLYIRKAGCFPRLPMLLLTGATANLRLRGEATHIQERTASTLERSSFETATLRAEPVVLTPSVQAELDTLDRAIVGYARSPEHTLWEEMMGGERGASRLFRKAGTLVGYAYMGDHSSGPSLACDPADLPRMVTHVAGLLAKPSPLTPEPGLFLASEHYMALAGTNEIVLRWLLDCGWQIVFQYLFMSSRPLGQLDRYICHNPLYVL